MPPLYFLTACVYLETQRDLSSRSVDLLRVLVIGHQIWMRSWPKWRPPNYCRTSWKENFRKNLGSIRDSMVSPLIHFIFNRRTSIGMFKFMKFVYWYTIPKSLPTDYLFDNKKIIDGGQRYDKILDDIKPLLKDDEGYKIWVTGHRYEPMRFSCSICLLIVYLIYSFVIVDAGHVLVLVPRLVLQ